MQDDKLFMEIIQFVETVLESSPEVIRLQFDLRAQDLNFCFFRYEKSNCLVTAVSIQHLYAFKNLNRAI